MLDCFKLYLYTIHHRLVMKHFLKKILKLSFFNIFGNWQKIDHRTIQITGNSYVNFSTLTND